MNETFEQTALRRLLSLAEDYEHPSGETVMSPTEYIVDFLHDDAVKAILRAAWIAGQEPVAWRPIDSAPKDGTLLLLLIGADDVRDHAVEDTDQASPTIGHNNPGAMLLRASFS